MTLDEAALQAHLNMTADEVAHLGEGFLAGLLSAAKAHTEAQLGFKLTDTEEFPDGAPDDVKHAVLMLGAHWFGQREATVVGVTMQTAPLGYEDIIRSHRRWTFG